MFYSFMSVGPTLPLAGKGGGGAEAWLALQ